MKEGSGRIVFGEREIEDFESLCTTCFFENICEGPENLKNGKIIIQVAGERVKPSDAKIMENAECIKSASQKRPWTFLLRRLKLHF